ncbi:MAG: HRDC domain-containing protein, partial [Phycisphaerales bacterium]
FDPEGQLRRIHRSEPLRPGQSAVARALVSLRYTLARSHDLPARVVLPDAAVIELAKRKPTERAAVMGLSGVPRRILQAHADEILAAVATAKGAAPASDPPNPLAEDPRVRAESDQVWNALQARCSSVGLAPNLVVTRASFSRWYVSMVDARRRGGTVAPSEGDSAMFSAGDWRHAAIGRWLEGFLRGDERLELVWSASGMVAPGYVRPAGAVASGP